VVDRDPVECNCSQTKEQGHAPLVQ
jgi:hypothetical protein